MSETDTKPTAAESTPRWFAAIGYRTDAGINIVDHDFEEIADLQSIIERGPDWNCIDRIVIKLQRPSGPADLTLEQSEKQ